MCAAKLAPGSLLTTDDQIRLYEEQKGQEAAERQVRLAKIATKQCVCRVRKMKRKWDGASNATTRTVHELSCPKWKRWMEEVTNAPIA